MGHSTSSGRAGETRNAAMDILKKTIRQASTANNLTAYNQVNGKAIESLTNEEKMVRALLTDELLNRGELIYDRGTGENVRNTAGDRVVYDEQREASYRIHRIYNQVAVDGTTHRAAEADVYRDGQWRPVINIQRRVDIAKLISRRRKGT